VSGNVFSQRKDMTSLVLVDAQTPWALDRLVDISNCSLAPPPHLVAKDPESTKVAISDGAFDGYAARSSLSVWNGPRVLDHKPSLGHRHLEGRVVEVAPRPALQKRVETFIDPPVESDEVTPRSKWEPVQVDPDAC